MPARGRRSGRCEALDEPARARLFSWWPSPSLDGNPVLWREWHRNRPSRMGRIGHDPLRRRDRDRRRRRHRRRHQSMVSVRNGTGLLVGVNMLASCAGLLLPSATAPTTLTEERVRGSLDILMSTPLSTRSIVLGKWWASYRRMLPLVDLAGTHRIVRGCRDARCAGLSAAISRNRR